MSSKKPNILLITTDQQRFDTAGSAAPEFMRTPHYDHLCREGVEFTSAYADCPLCVPARISIMTGKTVFSHGMATNGTSIQIIGRSGTLPAYLRELGYQTAAIGKMHFKPQRARHGFDEMILPEDYYREIRYSGSLCQPMRHGLGQNELYPSMSTVPESQTLTSWIAEQCVEYIRERRDPTAPFFLWCSFSKPHPPLDPPEPYYSMYRSCPIPEPVYGNWNKEDCPAVFKRFQIMYSNDLIPSQVIREARAAYYGLITQIDYNMGRIFAALQDIGLFHDTLIIYTSDHGEFLGDHHAGAKGFFYEPSAHVPFVLRMPKSWERRFHGTRISSLVTHADILPTLIKAAGGNIPADVDGQDLIALVRGEQKAHRKYLESMIQHVSECDYLAITDGRWKYIWYPEGSYEQLFDLHSDPKELRNLSGIKDYEEKCRELKDQMIRNHQSRNSKFLKDGELIAFPKVYYSMEDLRNNPLPGYHTDYIDIDARH